MALRFAMNAGPSQAVFQRTNRRSVMTAARMTAAELDAFLRTELPQMFNYDDLTIEHADGQTCQMRQRFRDSMLRPGGTISGPTLMALADFAMYAVLLSAIGPVGLAGHDQSQHQFSAQGPARAGCACGGKAFEIGQAACGRRGQFAVGNVAGSNCPCYINLFHSKSLEFSAVI
jgi:acyl-coenzyme A thioesterase PaaI-like protein